LIVRARTGVIDPLAQGLVVGARAILREPARLAAHLNRAALRLIFKRRDHVAFVRALQHALMPHPVEEHGPQILCSWCRCVRRASVRVTVTTPTLSTARRRCTGPTLTSGGSLLRAGCRCDADRDDNGRRDPCPTTA